MNQKTDNSRLSTILGLIAFTIPITTVLTAVVLFNVTIRELGVTIQTEEPHVAALSVVAELLHFGSIIGIGFLAGSILSIISLRLRQRFFWLGSSSLAFNLLSLIFLSAIRLKMAS